MDFFKYWLNTKKQINFRPATSLVLICILTVACVAKQLPVSERVRESGLDQSGRPKAYQVLPKDASGEVNWVASITEGILNPESSLEPGSESLDTVLDMDILFPIGKGYPIPNVIFPHKPHTLWLGCNNCHPGLFTMKQGGNPVSMDRIIKGEFCGRCHGVVAFPISNCLRCHSRAKTDPNPGPDNP